MNDVFLVENNVCVRVDYFVICDLIIRSIFESDTKDDVLSLYYDLLDQVKLMLDNRISLFLHGSSTKTQEGYV